MASNTINLKANYIVDETLIKSGPAVKSKTKSSKPINKDEEVQLTHLMSSGYYVCLVTLIIYTLLQYYIYSNNHSQNPICNHQIEYSTMSKTTSLISFLLFLFGGAIQLNSFIFEKIYEGKSQFYSLYLATFTIYFIAGSSSLITYLYNWGGICVDYFNVVTPASQWPEWIASVPFLVYISLSIDSRSKYLKKKELFVIFSMMLCIVFGFLMQLKLSGYASAVILIVSNLSIFATILMVHRDSVHSEKDNKDQAFLKVSASTEKEFNRISNAVKMRSLTYLLFFVFPIFPFIYILAMTEFLGQNGTLIAYQIAGLISKLMFAALAIRSHHSVIDRLVAMVDEEIQPMIQKIVCAMDIEDWVQN